jgi:hypothetical protein
MLRELVDLGTGGWIGWSRDSFWDAMIVRSAGEIGCTVLYSEDLDTGQDYSGVRMELRATSRATRGRWWNGTLTRTCTWRTGARGTSCSGCRGACWTRHQRKPTLQERFDRDRGFVCSYGRYSARNCRQSGNAG